MFAFASIYRTTKLYGTTSEQVFVKFKNISDLVPC